MRNIAIIGAGTMGNGIAHVMAHYGYRTNLIEIAQEALNKGLTIIGKNLDRMVAKQLITENDKKATLENIAPYTILADGVKKGDLVIEAATESTALKLKIFGELDTIC